MAFRLIVAVSSLSSSRVVSPCTAPEAGGGRESSGFFQDSFVEERRGANEGKDRVRRPMERGWP
eukprot:scaffold120632_cov27-Phaeocystis_antarctica.AAC.1